jgi:hypothetical protein
VSCSASVWCFSEPADLAWWSQTWAERIRGSDLAEHARALGVDQMELDDIATAWQAWAERSGAWFAVLHGEVIATA